jgi:oxygen-independent coproporphyrinogen-3 oxidase
MSFALYIHIPWCQAKCPYCDFNSYAADEWPEAEYVRAIAAEMTLRGSAEPFNRSHVKTIFFGGGTPSLFAAESIGAMIEAADRLFGIDDDCEITLEANPGTIDFDKLRAMRAAGVNRVSFGAQSFNPAILRYLGRIHSADETRAAANAAHRAGFERMNLDLIFAVPGQTIDDVRRDIESAAELSPDHISAYNLTFEPGTPFHTELKRGKIAQLESDDQAAMYSLVRERVPQLGYTMYEISNFARPGAEARHNLAYWRAESYMGLGAGAHGCAIAADGMSARRWWNEKIPNRYVEGVVARGTAEAGAESIDPHTAAGEFAFLNLRLRQGIGLEEFRARFGHSFDHRFGEVASRLIDGGLLERAGARIRLTNRGIELADSVFAEFV